jgi:hypothetical protein
MTHSDSPAGSVNQADPARAGQGEQAGRGVAGWEAGGAGVVRLPSGVLIRGRGLSHPLPSGHPPTFGVYLLGRPPPEFGWTGRWVRWPDFRLPSDRAAFRRLLPEILDRARSERVEIACRGGRGRTGTALACLAVLDGVPPGEAVDYIRAHYDPRAIETPWQRRFIRSSRPV